MPEQDVRDHLIDSLTTMFSKSGGNIQDFNLPRRSTSSESSSTNCFIEEELAYDIDNLLDESETFLRKLNTAQRHAFNVIVNTILNEEQGFYFLSGYGGTGKTFLWNAIITHLRSQRKSVLSVASSGVASLLLAGGHTSHSRFKIPCDDLDDSTTCNIRRGTMLVELIRLASLIIWDEAFMTHRIAFEALDRTLCDLLSS
jgi:ATP-dependent DNA helicase PIF1